MNQIAIAMQAIYLSNDCCERPTASDVQWSVEIIKVQHDSLDRIDCLIARTFVRDGERERDGCVWEMDIGLCVFVSHVDVRLIFEPIESGSIEWADQTI